ncbi:hypothetical protein WICPIJ_002626 [Wickerhamomyces pijperi]|uniref:BTB domain-containing protein n=1 Tax=Wickerhamomyces pijperi TaxID=599730 RepID=A0A9P8TPI6_WICPI|nr:hypothetical protein WICPIJ_002626 [Wickerhamomyces pijperi]
MSMSSTPQPAVVTKATGNQTSHYDPSIPSLLPPERMYTLQIGNKRFVLSGASLSSDGPSYFTNYFSNSANAEKVLFIDRSPEVFKLIYSHLQGYYIEIRDADLFTRLFNDALYYNLPTLRSVLINNEYYYVLVQGVSFSFSKSLVSGKGNFPNFFTVANDALYEDISNLIVDKNWIRPPPQAAPSLNRDLNLLKQLILLLQGSEVCLDSDCHRRNLIREAKYYRFFELVERLTKSKIIWNPINESEEILVPLEYLDLKSKLALTQTPSGFFWSFGRLYGDDLTSRVLIIQIDETGVVVKKTEKTVTFEFHGNVMNKLRSLLRNTNKKVLGNAKVTDLSTFSNITITEDNGPLVIFIPEDQFTRCTVDIEYVQKPLQNSEYSGSFDWKLTQCLMKFQFISVNQAGGYVVKPELVKAKVAVDQKDFYRQMEYL